ncbi:MAG: acyl-CoA desaturase [Deltaproteobacteria bacterium]|nr:acyl-CoA desaturase [Deltaproteobacteria bacterium]
MYLVLCLAVFVAAYLANVLTITVGYHRALAHQSVTLHPRLKRALVVGGNWLTGLDPRAWVVMHRLHHAHSDTPLDPHSPMNVGLLGIGLEQLRSYERILVALLKKDPEVMRYAKDLDFDLNVLNRSGLWWLPYAVHAAVGMFLGVSVGWLLGVAYLLGMMSHPVQGGLVNALGHAIGGRNFETRDNSRNNHLAAWLIFGEGFQNNHHAHPGSASFSHRRTEIDLGYASCVALEKLGLCTIHRAALIPREGAALPSGSEA